LASGGHSWQAWRFHLAGARELALSWRGY
jgi:hypothetical protein